MIERLIKTIPMERGELYVINRGRRFLLARCEPEVDIYENSTNVPVLGQRSYGVKKIHIAVVLCSDPDLTREVNHDFFRGVTRFELLADVQREDGVFENINFDNLIPEEINLNGDWVFNVEQPELIRKLLEI